MKTISLVMLSLFFATLARAEMLDAPKSGYPTKDELQRGMIICEDHRTPHRIFHSAPTGQFEPGWEHCVDIEKAYSSYPQSGTPESVDGDPLASTRDLASRLRVGR